MDQLLYVREKIICYYKRYETIINFIGKFIVGLLILNIINGIGGFREEFTALFQGPVSMPFLLLMALLFTILPPTLANGLLMLNLVIQVSKSLEAAFFILLLLLLVLMLYVRLAPKMSYLIIATLLGFYFRIPYAVVIFAGLYCGLTSIIPITVGVCIHSFVPFFAGLIEKVPSAAPGAETDIFNTALGFLDSYKILFENLSGNFDWVFTAFVFAMIVCAVYAVTRLTIDYARDIAVAIGTLVCILGFIIGNLVMHENYSIVSILLFTVLSAVLVECIRFFDSILNYKKAERVQFEDEENYYYVKIIPKIIADEGAIVMEEARKKSAAKPPLAIPRPKEHNPADESQRRKAAAEHSGTPVSAPPKRPSRPSASGIPRDQAALVRQRMEASEARLVSGRSAPKPGAEPGAAAEAESRPTRPVARPAEKPVERPAPAHTGTARMDAPVRPSARPSEASSTPRVRNLSDIHKPAPPSKTNINRK